MKIYRFKKYFLTFVSGCALISLLSVSKIDSSNRDATLNKPNVIIFVADDLGWNDVGFHGSEIQTPNIDKLVTEGVELNRFYTFPVCSPTRASLMTAESVEDSSLIFNL